MKNLAALTVHQPWSWLISVGAKPVENRDWRPPPQLVGGYLAIHAGKSVDEAAYRKLVGEPRPALWARPPVPAPEELVIGAIESVIRVTGAILTSGSAEGMGLKVERIVGQISAERARELAAHPYAFGPWLWVLDEVFRLPGPIPCRGMQKVWTVPDAYADAVREQWAAAHSRSATP